MNEERSWQQQPTTMTRCDTPAAAMIPCSVIAHLITYDSLRSDSDRLSSCFENTFYSLSITIVFVYIYDVLRILLWLHMSGHCITGYSIGLLSIDGGLLVG